MPHIRMHGPPCVKELHILYPLEAVLKRPSVAVI
jgi:hypothetical protein